MYCPNCGNQFPQGQKYCRTCGTHLAIISKAATLSEAIARSDRGPLPKIKAARRDRSSPATAANRLYGIAAFRFTGERH